MNPWLGSAGADEHLLGVPAERSQGARADAHRSHAPPPVRRPKEPVIDPEAWVQMRRQQGRRGPLEHVAWWGRSPN